MGSRCLPTQNVPIVYKPQSVMLSIYSSRWLNITKYEIY